MRILPLFAFLPTSPLVGKETERLYLSGTNGHPPPCSPRQTDPT
jgi:hypothetical protein